MTRKTKRLNVGDQLYAEGSWMCIDTAITAVTDTEAMDDAGRSFPRHFEDGYFLPTGGMDHNFWMLKNEC